MSSTPNAEAALTVALTAMPATPSPSQKAFDFDFTGSNYEMDASVSEEERRFYLKMYPTVDLVNQRKVHCTVCRMHIGTAASTEANIKMHPILRVTHCIKCHDFYNSGEFSKGEDGSELYCRWCGQGGEVYCCSTCPFVFCKSCIIKNLSRGVIVDIEQNENWNCFKCTSKILWPLRAQHWAHVNYIQTQKNGLQTMQFSESELRKQMHKDYSTCCRLAKAKANSLSDSMESLESNASKRSHASSVLSVKKSPKPQCTPAKRPKSSNDEVVCTPDLLSMLEPDCQISVAQKSGPRSITPAVSIGASTTPRIVTVQQNYSGPSPSSSSNGGNTTPGQPRSSLPPPLVLSSSGMRYRQAIPSPASVVRRTMVASAIRTPGPVFHTINGFRVDLNSAAQQDSYRLPNGRLIQVKRQLPPGSQPTTTLARAPIAINPQVIIRQQPATGASPRMVHPSFGSNIGIFNPQTNQQQRAPQVVRVNNGGQVHSVNISAPSTPVSSNGGTTIMMTPSASSKGPTLVRHVFPNSSIGTARSQLQEQIFNAMEICTHLTGKVQTLTHSNAYTQARSYMDLKELYIHLSYLMTYAIGRFKQLQDKCLVDMREMGFKNDANSLENGQLAAAVDYVCYGQLDDVDLFNTGCNSFHNQVYEYRKSLHANLKDGECSEPLPPLMPLGVRAEGDPKEEDDEQEPNDTAADNENDEPYDYDDDQDDDADDNDDVDDLDDEYDALGTEESMNRNEQAHAYDRKLTRLLREYPSIWCTRHPDYGKMEVTRKQWRVIATHFPRGDDIKLRWKNVRKRYVRIERLLKQGKRFKGYFDKATNYLANRDLPRSEWQPVDCGEGDGDGFERKQLDAIENTINKEQQDFSDVRQQQLKATPRAPVRPLELRPIDLRIINFAKSHPVLWRKSADPEFNSIDEQTRKSLWLNFWKSAPNKQASDDEDNEIEIVEPKTDTITIDSDKEEESPSVPKLNVPRGLKITSVKSTAPLPSISPIDKVTANIDPNTDIDVAAFSSSILASLLEVDISEGAGEVKANQKKQPRKKTTNKPNPALLHLERQRMEEIKRTDPKLKMKVVVNLRRAEDDFEVARQWIEAKSHEDAEECETKDAKKKESPDELEEKEQPAKNKDTSEGTTQNVKKDESDISQQVDSEMSAAEDEEKPCDDDDELREKINKTVEKTENITKTTESSISDYLEDKDNIADNENSVTEAEKICADVAKASKEIKTEITDSDAMEVTEDLESAEPENPSDEPVDGIENIECSQNQNIGDETETNAETTIAETAICIYADEAIKKEVDAEALLESDGEELDAGDAATIKTENTSTTAADSCEIDDEGNADATGAITNRSRVSTDQLSQADDPTESNLIRATPSASSTTDFTASSNPPKTDNV